MQPDLRHTRRALARRYGVFVAGLLLAFALGVYGQVSRSQSAQLRSQVEQLASTAAGELELLHHEHDEMHRPDVPVWLREQAQNALTARRAHADPHVRIRWFDERLTELKVSGGFEPAGTTIPATPSREHRQWLQLSNGLGLWQPVYSGATPDRSPRLIGYVAVVHGFSASAAELARLRQGLLIGALVAGLVAFLGSQWMVAASLDPIRCQIERLIRFSADASHELRHPLTAIRALIGSVRHGDLLAGAPPQLVHKLLQIDQSTARMGRLVDDLLLLSRADRAIDDGLAMTSFPLEELVEDLIDLHEAEAEAAGLELQGEVEANMVVRGQPERLRQLLENLLSNALRFSPPGGTVTVGLRRQRDRAQLWIDDQGPGIPAEQHRQIFERFWQADHARSSPNHLGLGLSIAQAIAEAHRGRLQVAVAPGGGCRMILELPLEG